MFKLIGNKVTKNGVVSIEQFFTDGEKEFAVTRAAELEATPGFTNIRLLETTLVKALIPVATVAHTATTAASGFKNKRLLSAKFAWVKFGKPVAKPKAVRKPRVAKPVAADAGAFDLPPVKKVRKTKREREFGLDVLPRTPEAAALAGE